MVALGAGVTGGIWRAFDGSDRAEPAADSPVAVVSAGPVFASLEELIAASDVVVIGRALAVAPGRLFAADDGSGVGSGVRSQVVTLEVGAVLSGPELGPTIVVEEEAATADGRPLVVDGLRPTAEGDQGIFFLVASADPDVPYLATVSTAGRYLRASTAAGDDRLLAATGPDSLATTLAALGGDELTARILRAASTHPEASAQPDS